MEKFVGCWELLPDQTTGFDEFSEALGTPKDKREAFKKLVYVLNYSRDGDQWKAWAQIKGHGEPKEYAWTPGVEFEYEALDGSKLKSTINWTGTCSDEKHELQNGGKWTSSRQVDGDIMTLISEGGMGGRVVTAFGSSSLSYVPLLLRHEALSTMSPIPDRPVGGGLSGTNPSSLVLPPGTLVLPPTVNQAAVI